MGDGIEVQLKELRKQVEEDRESRIAYEEARTAESKAAGQKAADRAAEQTRHFDQKMRMMARLDQGGLRRRKSRMGSREKRLPRVTRTRLRRYQHPEIVLCPSRLARERTNPARVGKTETTVSMVSPLTTHLAGDDHS